MNKIRQTGDRQQSETVVDKEIEALREILMAVNRLDDDARRRTFEYLRSKYHEQWPTEKY